MCNIIKISSESCFNPWNLFNVPLIIFKVILYRHVSLTGYWPSIEINYLLIFSQTITLGKFLLLLLPVILISVLLVTSWLISCRGVIIMEHTKDFFSSSSSSYSSSLEFSERKRESFLLILGNRIMKYQQEVPHLFFFFSSFFYLQNWFATFQLLVSWLIDWGCRNNYGGHKRRFLPKEVLHFFLFSSFAITFLFL